MAALENVDWLLRVGLGRSPATSKAFLGGAISTVPLDGAIYPKPKQRIVRHAASTPTHFGI